MCVCVCVCVCVCIYVNVVSSPYLLVFGNDRICGIREQMMSKVDLVMRRVEVGLVSREAFIRTFIFLWFYINCNHLYYSTFNNYKSVYNYGFWIIVVVIKVLNFPRFWEKYFIKWSWLFISLFLLFKSVISGRDVTLFPWNITKNIDFSRGFINKSYNNLR